MDLVYKGARFQIKKIEGLDVVDHPGSAVILPLIDPSTLLMIKNHRKAIGKTLLELPAGTLEDSELPMMCAKRELEEETGYKAKNLRTLVEFYASPGISNELIHVFVAENLVKGTQKLDANEEIEVISVKWSEALEMIRKGEIIDGKTILALLHYALF